MSAKAPLLRLARHALGAGFLLVLAACDVESTTASSASLTYTEDARAAYNEALAAYLAKDWEDAKALFAEVKKLFAYSRYAKLAELRIADIAFEQEKYADAISGYREFVQGHRNDPDIEYARYRIGRALYLDVDDTILLPPQEERDQATTVEAHKELRTFLREFPKSRYSADSTYMLEVVTGRLVRHELYVARYYLRNDVFAAAVARCDFALTSYPGSGLDPEALVLKGETLLKMKKRDEAKRVFESVVREHGGPFATTANDFLEEMAAQDKAKAAPKAP